MGVGSRGEIVDRGLKVLFFGIFLLLFPRCPPSPWKKLNVAIFRSFCYFSVFPPLSHPLKIFLPTPLASEVTRDEEKA